MTGLLRSRQANPSLRERGREDLQGFKMWSAKRLWPQGLQALLALMRRKTTGPSIRQILQAGGWRWQYLPAYVLGTLNRQIFRLRLDEKHAALFPLPWCPKCSVKICA